MATGRTTSRRKRGKKGAPARKKARRARGRKAKARKATARKPKARKAKTRKPKPKARAPRAKARRKPSARARAATTRARPTRGLEAAAPPPPPTAAPPAPAADDMQAHVEQALRDQGYDEPDQTTVGALAAIGRGYAQGPARPPAWLQVDVNGLVAEGIVERFATGDRAHDIDRSTHRPQVRATVNINLDQLGGGNVRDGERDVITSFCLGSWDPDMDTHAEANGIASFVVPWYLAGR